MIPLLLKAGANINIKNKDGFTERDLADKYNHPECISILDNLIVNHFNP